MTDETDLEVRVAMLEYRLHGLEERLDVLAQDAMERIVILKENLARAEGRLDVLEQQIRRLDYDLGMP